ncbi:MAG: hypothetical protein WBA89_04345 [Microcoleus sp.]
MQIKIVDFDDSQKLSNSLPLSPSPPIPTRPSIATHNLYEQQLSISSSGMRCRRPGAGIPHSAIEPL